MLDSFLYSVNIILPVLLIVALGYILKRIGFLTKEFTDVAEKLVFKVALPVQLFLEIAQSDGISAFSGKFIIFCVCGILILFFALCLTVPLFIKENDKRGAFIQGVYRTNFAILGIPLATSMFPEDGGTQIAVIMPFAIFLFNALAVVILSIYAPKERRLSKGQLVLKIFKSTVTNSLIIGIVLALPFMIFKIQLPAFTSKALGYLSNMTMPVSLICVGATFSFSSLAKRMNLAISATLLKTVAVPLVAVTAAVLLGFRGSQLGVILILFGAPTAVASYVMAKNMKSDYELAGQILLLTTLICLSTLFLFIFVLKSLGFI